MSKVIKDQCKCGVLKDARAKACRKCHFDEKAGINNGLRQCNKCEQLLPLDSFRIRTRATPRPRSTCKECEAKASNEYMRGRSKEVTRQKKREYYQNNPDIAKRQAIRSFCYKLGMSKDQALEVIEEFNQQTCCNICNKTTEEIGTLRIDHCHATGKIRGFLCNSCNLALGMLKDSIATLENAIKYLKAGEN